MGHETYKADLGCGLQTRKSAIFDLYSYTKSVPSVQSRERHSLPPAIKIDRLIFDSMGISFFDNYFIWYFFVRDFPYGDLPHGDNPDVDHPRKGFPVLVLRKRTPTYEERPHTVSCCPATCMWRCCRFLIAPALLLSMSFFMQDCHWKNFRK